MEFSDPSLPLFHSLFLPTVSSQLAASWPSCVATGSVHATGGLILAQIIPANGENSSQNSGLCLIGIIMCCLSDSV